MDNLTKEQQDQLDFLAKAANRDLQVSQLITDTVKKLESIFGQEDTGYLFNTEDDLEKILLKIKSIMPETDDGPKIMTIAEGHKAIQIVKDAMQQAEKIMEGYKPLDFTPMTVSDFKTLYEKYGDTRHYLVEANTMEDFCTLQNRFYNNEHVHLSYTKKP